MLKKSQLFRQGLAWKCQGAGGRQLVTRLLRTQSRLLKKSGLLVIPQPSATLNFQTSAVQNDSCLPNILPPKCGPKNCTIPKPNIYKECKLKKRPKWTGCEKICMPCCCPTHDPPDCNSIEIRLNTCKRPEYRIPAFSECRKFPLGSKFKKECCYKIEPCPEAGVDTLIEPLISTKVRQETVLGRRRGGSVRTFSTSAAAQAKQDCKKSNLTCLQPSGVKSSSSKKAQNKVCEKICIPCCRPAREPPECYYPYVKTECTRVKPPRPSFSECEKMKVKNIPECECVVGPLPPCKGAAGTSLKSC